MPLSQFARNFSTRTEKKWTSLIPDLSSSQLHDRNQFWSYELSVSITYFYLTCRRPDQADRTARWVYCQIPPPVFSITSQRPEQENKRKVARDSEMHCISSILDKPWSWPCRCRLSTALKCTNWGYVSLFSHKSSVSQKREIFLWKVKPAEGSWVEKEINKARLDVCLETELVIFFYLSYLLRPISKYNLEMALSSWISTKVDFLWHILSA